MTLDDLVAYYKTAYNFEKKTGLSNINWTHWKKKGGYISFETQRKIEKITKGELVARMKDSLKPAVRDMVIKEVMEDLARKQKKDKKGNAE